MDTNTAPVFLPVGPFAARTSFSGMTIRRMIKRGQIRAVRIGRSIRIPASELERITTPIRPAAASR